MNIVHTNYRLIICMLYIYTHTHTQAGDVTLTVHHNVVPRLRSSGGFSTTAVCLHEAH